MAAAQAVLAKKGGESGTVAALESLGVDAGTKLGGRSAPELAYIAVLASRGDLRDISRRAFDALGQAAPGAPMTADVDG